MRSALLYRLILSAYVICCAYGAQAKTVTLFVDGQQVENYDEAIASIKANDIVRFSEGKEFKVERVAGQGNTTKIIAIGNKRVLRVPLGKGMHYMRLPNGKYRETMDYLQWHNGFWNGYEQLTNLHAQVGKVYLEESVRNEYIVAEELDFKFNLDQFLKGEVPLTDAQQQTCWEEFFEFAQKNAMIGRIKDAHEENINYTNKGWLITDQSSGVSEAEVNVRFDPSRSFYSIFLSQDIFERLPLGAQQTVIQRIASERALRGLPMMQVCDDIQGMFADFSTKTPDLVIGNEVPLEIHSAPK